MLPIHIFEGTQRYVLVRSGTRVARGGDQVEPGQARHVIASALRHPNTTLIHELGLLLELRGEDLEDLRARTLEGLHLHGGLVLIRTKLHEVRGPRHEVSLPTQASEAVENEIETHWIEVKLVSEDEPPEPIPNALYEIELPNGQLRTGRLDDAGMVRLDGIPPGECKVRFPEYEEPDEAGEVEEEEPEPDLPPNTCEIISFDLQCSHHGKRGHKLELPIKTKSADMSLQAIEVLGARKGEGDKIGVVTTMLGPRCAEHISKGIEVVRPRPSERLEFATDSASFEAYYGDITVSEWLWPWRLEPVEYKVRPLTCDANKRHDAIVRVYPAYEISLKVAIGLDGAQRSKDKLKASQAAGKVERRGRPAHSDWKFTIEGAITYGSKKIALGAELEGKLANIRAVNLWVKRGIDQFCEIFKKYIGLDVELILPNLSLEYVGKFIELSNSPKVSPEWNLTMLAEPLIGLAIKTDVLELIIKALAKVPALTAVMNFLLYARKLAKETGNKLELVASLSGRVGFELKGSKDKSKQKVETSATGIGEVLIGFEGTAEGSVDVLWFVSFKAGASVKAATGLQIRPGVASDDTGFALTGNLILKPLEFEYGAYASGKFSWQSKEVPKAGVTGKYVFWDEKKLFKDGKVYVTRYDGKSP